MTDREWRLAAKMFSDLQMESFMSHYRKVGFSEYGVIGLSYTGGHPEIDVSLRKMWTAISFGSLGISIVHHSRKLNSVPSPQCSFDWESIAQILVVEPMQKMRNPGTMVGSGLSRVVGFGGRTGAFVLTLDERSGTATFLNDLTGPSTLVSILAPLWHQYPQTRRYFCFPHLGDQPSSTTPAANPVDPDRNRDLATQLEDVQRSLSLLSEDDEWRGKLLERRNELLRRILSDE